MHILNFFFEHAVHTADRGGYNICISYPLAYLKYLNKYALTANVSAYVLTYFTYAKAFAVNANLFKYFKFAKG